jgi:hypothetical protein
MQFKLLFYFLIYKANESEFIDYHVNDLNKLLYYDYDYIF